MLHCAFCGRRQRVFCVVGILALFNGKRRRNKAQGAQEWALLIFYIPTGNIT